jgi:hypothetical protein
VLVVNEATYRAHTDEAIRRKSGYLAAVVWAKQASEAMTSRDAQAALRQLADQGLDEKTLFTTYEALQADGIPPEWLDLDFQLRTLREYRPAELAGLLPDASPPEADADAA